MKVVTKDTLKYFWGKVKTYIGTAVSTKQDTLVSGTSIKTVNSTSLLGSGDVDVDNVVHGKLESGSFYPVESYALNGTPSFSNTAVTGDVNKIYIDVTTNLVYRYRNSYIQIGGGDLSNYYTKSEVNSAIVDSNPVIEDTRSALAPKITGVAPFSALVDKQRVTIHLAHGPGNSTTLELTLSDGVTTTGAIPVYARTYSGGLGQIADGHFRAGTYMELIYNSTQNRWYCLNLDRDTTTWKMSQSEINNSTNSDPRSVPTAKLLRDNFYTKSEIDATIGDIETLLASI